MTLITMELSREGPRRRTANAGVCVHPNLIREILLGQRVQDSDDVVWPRVTGVRRMRLSGGTYCAGCPVHVRRFLVGAKVSRLQFLQKTAETALWREAQARLGNHDSRPVSERPRIWSQLTVALALRPFERTRVCMEPKGNRHALSFALCMLSACDNFYTFVVPTLLAKRDRCVFVVFSVNSRPLFPICTRFYWRVLMLWSNQVEFFCYDNFGNL